MFAAAAGVLAVAGMASAQSPPPNPLPRIPVAPAAPVQPASAVAHVKGSGGCVGCGPAIQTGQYGPGQRNGCGSYRSDAGFIFGSCKSFFDPCGPLPCEGHGKFGLFRNPCPTHPYARPYGTGFNTCQYDTYHNH
ncbi:MAG: hypothetical protein C0501_00685 [Isosphaera sp.]|nr:hypothetical protein [Isosphaera sp.]